MITHTKALDVELERDISRIRNYIERNHLRYLQNKLVYGRSFKWKWNLRMQKHPYEKVPILKIYQEYLDESKENNYGK